MCKIDIKISVDTAVNRILPKRLNTWRLKSTCWPTPTTRTHPIWNTTILSRRFSLISTEISLFFSMGHFLVHDNLINEPATLFLLFFVAFKNGLFWQKSRVRSRFSRNFASNKFQFARRFYLLAAGAMYWINQFRIECKLAPWSTVRGDLVGGWRVVISYSVIILSLVATRFR